MGGGIPGITHTNPTSIPDDAEDLAAGKVCTQTHWMGAYSTSHSMSGIWGWQLVQQSSDSFRISSCIIEYSESKWK